MEAYVTVFSYLYILHHFWSNTKLLENFGQLSWVYSYFAKPEQYRAARIISTSSLPTLFNLAKEHTKPLFLIPLLEHLSPYCFGLLHSHNIPWCIHKHFPSYLLPLHSASLLHVNTGVYKPHFSLFWPFLQSIGHSIFLK